MCIYVYFFMVFCLILFVFTPGEKPALAVLTQMLSGRAMRTMSVSTCPRWASLPKGPSSSPWPTSPSPVQGRGQWTREDIPHQGTLMVRKRILYRQVWKNMSLIQSLTLLKDWRLWRKNVSCVLMFFLRFSDDCKLKCLNDAKPQHRQLLETTYVDFNQKQWR